MGYDIFISTKPIDGREIEEIDGIPVIKPIQIHSSRIVFAGRKQQKLKGDAIVTDSKNVWIGVLTADCLPIILIAKNMVGVIHAGWRGTLKGITFKTAKYIETFGHIEKAIIGPGICKNCYEVGYDVYSLFSPQIVERGFEKINSQKYLMDLKGINIIQLQSAGVKVIEDLNFCTVCNNDLFYSYRKEKTEKRVLTAVRIT